ncbi:MAG: Ig-like domain-containing protein [bacterium]|nr:Ig-like domain-containing protein [bacterium]
MKRSIWGKRLPTVLGILIIVVGIGVTSLLVKTGVIFIGRASPSEIPENIRISNLSDTAFTVSYTTEAKILGTISFGKDTNLGSIAIDDRDQAGNIGSYQTHHITVRNLKPLTKYFFSINSGQNTVSNNDVPFDVTTESENQIKSSSQQKVTGNVIAPDATIPSEAIVYLAFADAQTASSLLKSDGSYSLSLNYLLNQAEDTIVQIVVVTPSQQSNITVFAKQSNPVPLITLSKNYDFTISTSPIASESAVASKAAQINFPALSVSPASSKEPQILTPKKDEGLSDLQPLFKGTASPETTVKIIINSEEPIQNQVVADKSGNWTFRPTKPLSPGQHTISIITQDKFGILKTITQSFTVYAQGSQVAQSATPSATPTLTITPSPKATASASPTPTITSTPTPTPTPIESGPTPTLTPTTAATKGGLSEPGNEVFSSYGIAALGTIAIGIFLFLLTRGGTPP